LPQKILQTILLITWAALSIGTVARGEDALPPQVQSKSLRGAEPISLRGAEALTLSQVQTIALRQNRDVLEAQLEVSKTEANLKSVITTRFPQILAIAFVGQQVTEDHQGTTKYPQNVAALPGIFQPVTQQYRLGLQVQEATIRMRIAQQRLRLAKQQTVAAVKRLYLSMVALQSATVSLQQNFEFLGELERYVKFEFEKGSVLPSDLLLVQARVARADFEVDQAKDDLITLGQTLNRLLGRPPLSQVVLREESMTPFIEVNEDATIAEAVAKRPELEEIKLNVSRSHLESKIELSRYIPDISIGGLGSFSHFFNPPLPNSLVSVGFLGVWEPWDWGRRIQLSKEADREMKQSKIKLLDSADSVAISADKARRALKVAVKEVKAGALAESSTQEQLRIANRRFKVGAALLKDVLEAQTAYAKAITENVKAKSDFATVRVDLDEALGRDF
jgi:outer membrane protein